MELATSKSTIPVRVCAVLRRAAPRRELQDLFADAKPAMHAELLMLVQVMYLRCGGVVLSLASIARASAEALLPLTETPHPCRDSDVLRPQAAHHMCHVYYARSLGPLRLSSAAGICGDHVKQAAAGASTSSSC
uniref:Uncharacterized protein n=1 Tax=Oryza meridionalis TaxID=40149 RepID=A0A0E0DXC7_9ORYZ